MITSEVDVDTGLEETPSGKVGDRFSTVVVLGKTGEGSEIVGVVSDEAEEGSEAIVVVLGKVPSEETGEGSVTTMAVSREVGVTELDSVVGSASGEVVLEMASGIIAEGEVSETELVSEDTDTEETEA